jgi:uncharacterized protein (TIGR02246 family)
MQPKSAPASKPGSEADNTSMKTLDDEDAIREFPLRMIDAWNAGDGEAFASPFSDTADFIAFEGTRLKGRAEIAAFHQEMFDTVVRGSRLDGGVEFVRLIGPRFAVMHAVATTTLPGASMPSPSRESMQIFVTVKSGNDWQVEALMNARRLTLEQQLQSDEFHALPAEAQIEAAAFISRLRDRQTGHA